MEPQKVEDEATEGKESPGCPEVPPFHTPEPFADCKKEVRLVLLRHGLSLGLHEELAICLATERYTQQEYLAHITNAHSHMLKVVEAMHRKINWKDRTIAGLRKDLENAEKEVRIQEDLVATGKKIMEAQRESIHKLTVKIEEQQRIVNADFQLATADKPKRKPAKKGGTK